MLTIKLPTPSINTILVNQQTPIQTLTSVTASFLWERSDRSSNNEGLYYE